MFAAGEGHAKGFTAASISHWARTSRERNLYNLYVKGRAHCLARSAPARHLDGFYLNQSDYRAWQEEVRPDASPSPCCSARSRRVLFKAIAEGWSRLNAGHAGAGSGLRHPVGRGLETRA